MGQVRALHAQIILRGFAGDKITISKLVSFCALSPSGDQRYADYLFERIPHPNRHMYNTLIRASVNTEKSNKAILLYGKMVRSGISPNEFTFPFILKACAFLGAHLEGVGVHLNAVKLGFAESHICVQNGLINFYVGCGKIACAREIFDWMDCRTLVSWNSMIGGYGKMGNPKEAFLLFIGMRDEGMELDGHTFVNLLSVCSRINDIRLGMFLHWYFEINGFHTDAYVQNALLDMYAKCGNLQMAEAVFARMVDKNVVSWTSMVSAYAKHGFVEPAERTFHEMPVKSVVSWNSMTSCYLQNGYYKKSLEIFDKMRDSSLMPDETTIATVLSACSQLGDLDTGKKLHNYLCENNVRPTITLFNALVDMYAKCGSTETALDVFLDMSEKNLVSWNTMINALALHGSGYGAVELFQKMEATGIHPDAVTFSGLLSACCHCDLIDTARSLFHQMDHLYRIPREIEHYACMVDILSRRGLFEEALQLIGEMAMKPDVVIWGALLGACRIHRNVPIAKLVLKQLLEMEPYTGGLYVLVANIFSESQQWDEMKKMRNLIKYCSVWKSKAVSSIEVGGSKHDFMVYDKNHEDSDLIYRLLDYLKSHLNSEGDACSHSVEFAEVQ